MKDKKQTKKKIGLGYVVKEKVGEMEDNTREGRSRRMRKYVVGCVQTVVGKKRLLFQLEYGKNEYMSSCLLVFLCPKEEVEMYEPLLNSTKK